MPQSTLPSCRTFSPALLVIAALFAGSPRLHAASATQPSSPSLEFIHTGFDNASPLQWTVDPDGTVHVHMLYDYERNSPNRAAGHWHFQLHTRPDADLTLILHDFDNIWNGRPGSAVRAGTTCYASEDGKTWSVIPTEKLPDSASLRIRVRPRTGRLYLARLEPYRISDLERFLEEIRPNPLVQVIPVGHTVENRPLEIIRVGNPDAPHRVLLRARAHPWEPGGNWVVQGLIRALLRDDPLSIACRTRYCLYVLPMANKDGVARGRTRFNLLGKDLNRNWDRPADPALVPENHALETWLSSMLRDRRPVDLFIDLHNDDYGGLRIDRPAVDPGPFLARMARLDQLLRQHTGHTERADIARESNPASLSAGLMKRFAISACVLELNANRISSLDQPPTARAWEQLGSQLRQVFHEYFEIPTPPAKTGPTPASFIFSPSPCTGIVAPSNRGARAGEVPFCSTINRVHHKENTCIGSRVEDS